MSSKSLKKTAGKLVALCREGKEAKALDTLYDRGAVSVEAAAMPGSDSAEAAGLDAIRAKHAWWFANFEVHETKTDGPFLHGDDRFGVIFEIDATHKETGKRSKSREIAVYHVNKAGKIVREEFFYGE